MNDIEYIRAMLNYKKWERTLKSLPKEERKRVMRIYQIDKPTRYSKNITVRALEVNSL